MAVRAIAHPILQPVHQITISSFETAKEFEKHYTSYRDLRRPDPAPPRRWLRRSSSLPHLPQGDPDRLASHGDITHLHSHKSSSTPSLLLLFSIPARSLPPPTSCIGLDALTLCSLALSLGIAWPPSVQDRREARLRRRRGRRRTPSRWEVRGGVKKKVAILNSIWSTWGLTYQTWNISGEPCRGATIDDSISFDDNSYNPFIKCDCSFNNSTTCHITQLKVYALSVAGPIPDELWNLTYLFNLNLAQNLLTGSLSPSIGNLTRMQYLSVGINALSGELPPQLGLLTELLSLSFSTNNFNGSLPSELGNLSKLQQLYFDSSGVSGEIPSTFSKLKNLHTVWASDNNLIGSIPEFIGDWSQLTQLFLQGNSFEGSIPSTFSNLSALIDLRISDVSNVNSSLEFIRNMKNLSILVLRNNNVSDSLPSDFSGYQSLSQLDLSFNKLTGQIPDSLFNLSSLTYLFLGNNSLNGTLPEQKSASLLN
ncbi:hypothetical protein NL676_028532, partial [Syzygium grande]